MFGDHNDVEDDGKGNKNVKTTEIMAEENPANGNKPMKIFSPHASVVTWFGGDTGNKLSALMNFTTGIPWEEAKSEIFKPSGEEGESKQSVIDGLLGDSEPFTGMLGSASHDGIKSFLQGGSYITSKITSFGKLTLAMNGKIGIDQ